MSSITLNTIRNGSFTSSEIIALTTNGKAKGTYGKPFYTYIEEKNMERRLGRSIESEENARALSWGKLCEKYVSDNPELLGIEYSVNLSDTTPHPTIPFWCGSEDATKEDAVGDIKCPKTLKSFCQLVDPYMEDGNIVHPALTIEAVRANHKDGDKYYWQITSNAIIHNKPFGELIVFVPYQSELQKIRELANNWDNPDEQWKYSWVFNSNDTELPYLIDGGYYKNINVIRFSIPEEDKIFLTNRVLEAGKLLQEVKSESLT